MGRLPRRAVRASIAAAILVGLVSCSSSSVPSANEASTEESTPILWAHQALDLAPDHDAQMLFTAVGNRAVALTADPAHAITGAASYDGAAFVVGAPTPSGNERISLTTPTPFGDGWLAVGTAHVPDAAGADTTFGRVVRSADGQAWSPVDAIGFDLHSTATAAIGHDGGAVAVGSLLPFVAAAWRTVDGMTWTSVTLPTDGGRSSSVADIASTASGLLAVGEVDRHGVLWSSSDGGTSWAIVGGLPATDRLREIVVQGDVVVVSGSADIPGVTGGVLLRSSDDGNTWEATPAPPPDEPGLGVPLFAGGGRFFTISRQNAEVRTDATICYDDIARCQRGPSAYGLSVSDDGGTWLPVDLPHDDAGAPIEPWAVASTDDGRVLVVTGPAPDATVWTWPAGEPLPTREATTDEPAPAIDLLADDDQPKLGRRYARPLSLHCGMDTIVVAREAWQRTDDAPDSVAPTEDSYPEDWPVALGTIYGHLTLVADDRIEYSIGDREVIATYAPAGSFPVGCL